MTRALLAVVASAVIAVACTSASPGTTGVASTSTAATGTATAATAAPTGGSATPAGATATAVIALGHSCRAPATPTLASTEGPFFKAGSPEKASLVTADMPGTRVQLFGFVLTRSCAAVVRAKVDIWQADANGNYDTSGYRLRGHVFTDSEGRYSIQTIMPGRYPGRTPHIHVKVEPQGGPGLTTQLYMPNEQGNSADSIFRPELTVPFNAPTLAVFTFIIDKP